MITQILERQERTTGQLHTRTQQQSSSDCSSWRCCCHADTCLRGEIWFPHASISPLKDCCKLVFFFFKHSEWNALLLCLFTLSETLPGCKSLGYRPFPTYGTAVYKLCCSACLFYLLIRILQVLFRRNVSINNIMLEQTKHCIQTERNILLHIYCLCLKALLFYTH